MTTRPLLALALAATVALAACGDASQASDDPTTAPTDTPTEAPAASPSEAPPTPTVDPSLLPDPGPTEVPPASEAPSGSASASPSNAAAACSGNAENQAFFANVAAGVDWTVLCLARDGWVVTSGNYSLRNGGALEIGYRGPGGATLELREGYICEGEGCAPTGTPLGDVSLGELTNAQVIDTGDGSLAVVADPDANPSWIVVTTGINGDDLAELAATGFATVAG